MLVVFGGSPETGTTPSSRAVATRRTAAYLHIDFIEPPMRTAGVLHDSSPTGYVVANALAASDTVGAEGSVVRSLG